MPACAAARRAIGTRRETAHVILADHMAEFDRARVTAMFTADTHFQRWASGATIIDGHAHQFAYTIPVELLEGFFGKMPSATILYQEVALGIITAVTKGHLGQIIGTEGEELRHSGNLSRHNRGAGISIMVPNL